MFWRVSWKVSESDWVIWGPQTWAFMITGVVKTRDLQALSYWALEEALSRSKRASVKKICLGEASFLGHSIIQMG